MLKNEVTVLISNFRKVAEQNSISPEKVGYLMQLILDCGVSLDENSKVPSVFLPIVQQLSDSTTTVLSSKAVKDAILSAPENEIPLSAIKSGLAGLKDVAGSKAPHLYQLVSDGRNVGNFLISGDNTGKALDLLLATRLTVKDGLLVNSFGERIRLFTARFDLTSNSLSRWVEVGGTVIVDGDGGQIGGGGSSDLKKYSIWIESREKDPEDNQSAEPYWIVTDITGGLRDALNEDPQNTIVELCVNLGFDFAFKVPAVTTTTQTGHGGVMVMATIGGQTFTVTVDDDPEQCEVSVEEQESEPVLKGIRTYNGISLEGDKSGFIGTRYGDIYVDIFNDSANRLLELKVNPVGSIATKSPIVTPDTVSLQAQAGRLYRYDSEVNMLAVTLPDMEGYEYAADIILMFKAGDFPSVTIQSAGNGGVQYQQGFSIEAGRRYEVSALWNGARWTVASLEILDE